MAQIGEARQRYKLRWLAWSLLVAVVWAAWANTSWAQDGSGTPAVETTPFWQEIIDGLLETLFKLKTTKLMAVLGRPECMVAAFITLNIIVFVETGLLIGFCLPGDSLLVTAGIVCSASNWNLPLLLLTLCLSAIIGDTVGYAIGYKTGPKIFNREKSFFFNRDHLLAAQKFYEEHGGKTIILARFVPIIRTFAPVVAGVGKMRYRQFLYFNIFGGIGWVVSMILIGYYLKRVIDPIFQSFLGEQFSVENHVEKVILIVVFLSITPGIYMWLKNRMKGKPSPQPELAAEPVKSQV